MIPIGQQCECTEPGCVGCGCPSPSCRVQHAGACEREAEGMVWYAGYEPVGEGIWVCDDCGEAKVALGQYLPEVEA